MIQYTRSHASATSAVTVSAPEHLDDRAEQIVVHDRVLLGRDAQRRVLVRDPGHHLSRVGEFGIDEVEWRTSRWTRPGPAVGHPAPGCHG
jgi:hypothetical protein